MPHALTRSFQNKILIGIAFALLTSCSTNEKLKTQDRHPLTLQGTSSTFGLQAYLRWFNQLAVHEDIYAEIDSMGSGQSIRTFLNGTNDFAGTDDPPSAQEIQKASKGVLAFPVTAGAIAVAYNAPGCDLRLRPSQLSGIFLGNIDNFSQLGCDDVPITVLHRDGESGSTESFTSALSSMDSDWKNGPGNGRSVQWPVGEAVKGSDGMATALQSTPGSIGYIEAAYIREPLQVAALRNRRGDYVRPTQDAARAAVSTIRLNERLVGTNPDPNHGYPIVTLNWMLVPARGLGSNVEAIRRSLEFILSNHGQDDAERLGYVPLPNQLRERSLKQLSKLQP